jgi:cobalt-zinc-cadmium efflux system membrane fusion protein
MKKIARYTFAAFVLAAATALAAWYVFLPAGASRPTAAKSQAHGVEEKGHEHGDGVKLTDAQIAAAGIELATAGPRDLRQVLHLPGVIQPNQETVVKVTSRFPGVIRSMRKRLGDKVRKDEVLATVESNQSLTVFELKATMDGTVIDRDGTLGEFASEQRPLFTIADLGTMWVDLAVYRRDFERIRAGDGVSIDLGDRGAPIASRIDYVSPLSASETQSTIARAVVANDGRLRSGLFVTGQVVLSTRSVAVAARTSALQTLEGKTVVFVRSGESFEARDVELGERDTDWVEVKFGLLPGDVYAARNSFVIKAELGKSGAAHEH